MLEVGTCGNVEPSLEPPLLGIADALEVQVTMASMLQSQPPMFSSLRLYSQVAEKPSLKLVAEMRELTEASITKACDALVASNNDVSATLT